MGLVVVLLRWANLFFSVRAAHKAIKYTRRANQPARQGANVGNGRGSIRHGRRQPGRRREDRAETLRALITRFVIWMLYRRAEAILDRIGQWILFYDTVKTLFLFWLLVSQDLAASQLFHAVVEPAVQPYEPLIDAIALRTVRTIHAVNFLVLLFFVNASQRTPERIKNAAITAKDAASTAYTWMKRTSIKWRSQNIGEDKDVRAQEQQQPRGRDSESPPPFLPRPVSELDARYAHAPLPGSWRPLQSPDKAVRPTLPDNWMAAVPPMRPAGNGSGPSRRVVSNGNEAPRSAIPRLNGAPYATISARTLARAPPAPVHMPVPFSSRVRLMPDWPESPLASVAATQPAASTSAANGAPLGRPPSSPDQLIRAFGLTPKSAPSVQRQLAASSPKESPKETPRKRKRQQQVDDDAYKEDGAETKGTTLASAAAASKVRSPRGAAAKARGGSGKTTRASASAAAKGKGRALDDAPASESTSDGLDPPPVRKRTRTTATKTKEGSGEDEDMLVELPPPYSSRTLRARPQREDRSTPSVALPPPAQASTRSKRTIAQTSAESEENDKAEVTNGTEGTKKTKSSTSTAARKRALGTTTGGTTTAAAEEKKRSTGPPGSDEPGSSDSGPAVNGGRKAGGTARQSRRREA